MALFQNGIDVSRYQGNINWGRVAAAGKQFAIVRVGSGNSRRSVRGPVAFCRTSTGPRPRVCG